MGNQAKQSSENDNDGRNLNIDIEHMSVTGHVAFAGRDASIQVNTGGDVALNSENTITVGGIETTQEAHDQLVSTFETVEQKFEDEEADEETREAARHYIGIIKNLLLGKKRPNPKILVNTVKSLAKLGPLFIGGIAAIFGEPLATQIIAELAGASGFFKVFLERFGA